MGAIMAVPVRLRERSSAITERWLRDTLATYPEQASATFRREKDPFANPVGHALRVGAEAVMEALLEEKEAEEICSHLDEVIRIRAIQEFTPSEAVSFVFLLKEAVREECGEEGGDRDVSAELDEFDRQIDRIALSAFDRYVGYRQKVYELRINEVKRSVATIVERMNRRSPSPESDEAGRPSETSNRAEAQRGAGQ